MEKLMLPEQLKSWKVGEPVSDAGNYPAYNVVKTDEYGAETEGVLTYVCFEGDNYNRENVDLVNEEAAFVKSVIKLRGVSNYLDAVADNDPSENKISLYLLTNSAVSCRDMLTLKSYTDAEIIDFGLQISEILDKLEQNKLRREDDDPTEYYDKDGNRITKNEEDGKYYDKDGKEVDMPTFYKKEYTIAEISKEAKASVSIYDKTWTSENASANITVGEAEAHAKIAGGFYVIGADGEKKFSPGVNAEVGASVTVFEATGEAQLVGDEMLGVNVDGKVTLGKAEAKAEVGAQVFGEDGKLDVQLGASASAELIGAEAEASLGVNVLGGEVAGKVGVNVGIGAHADVGYRDGKLKFDVGASVGVGFSVDVEVDIGGMVDTVCDVAESAWDTVKDGWNNFWSW
jgi:hypothetical protein